MLINNEYLSTHTVVTKQKNARTQIDTKQKLLHLRKSGSQWERIKKKTEGNKIMKIALNRGH